MSPATLMTPTISCGDGYFEPGRVVLDTLAEPCTSFEHHRVMSPTGCLSSLFVSHSKKSPHIARKIGEWKDWV